MESRNKMKRIKRKASRRNLRASETGRDMLSYKSTMQIEWSTRVLKANGVRIVKQVSSLDF